MFVHSVYFWLKEDLTDDERAALRGGIESLAKIEATEEVYVGAPADTDRPVVEASYDFGLTVLLADRAAHDVYQVDPIHLAFVDEFSGYWTKVVIYDAE